MTKPTQLLNNEHASGEVIKFYAHTFHGILMMDILGAETVGRDYGPGEVSSRNCQLNSLFMFSRFINLVCVLRALQPRHRHDAPLIRFLCKYCIANQLIYPPEMHNLSQRLRAVTRCSRLPVLQRSSFTQLVALPSSRKDDNVLIHLMRHQIEFADAITHASQNELLIKPMSDFFL